MSDHISISHLYQRIPPATGQRQNAAKESGAQAPNFERMLQANLLKFSHHAETRLAQRGIHMQPEQLAKLSDAVKQAEAKGARESLILMPEAAFIVNVKNRTVVTAIDGASLNQHVFTQIDSAVIVDS